MEYAKRYFDEVGKIAHQIDLEIIERMVAVIVAVKKAKGRIFFLGTDLEPPLAKVKPSMRSVCFIDDFF